MSEFKADRISIDKGLSQSTVYCIIQDSEGFMWFATEEGLNRYDGYDFKVFKNFSNIEESVVSNHIKTVYEDKKNILWIGTLNGYLIKYQKDINEFVNIKVDAEDTNLKSELTTIVEDRNGMLWIGTLNCGLKIYDKEKNEFTSLLKNEKNNFGIQAKDITSLCVDTDGLIWIGTLDDGLYLYDHGKNTFSNFNVKTDQSDIISNRIRCIYQDSNKRILIGTKCGLNSFCKNNNNFPLYVNELGKSFPKLDVTSICEDKNNDIWVGTYASGIVKIESKKDFCFHKTDHNDQTTISNDSIFCTFVDKSNVIWVGSLGGGLTRIDGSRKKFFTLNKSVLDNKDVHFNSIFSFHIDSKGWKWIGTYNKGLYILKNGKAVKCFKDEIRYRAFTEGTVTKIVEDSNENIWVSNISLNALIKFCRKEENFQIFSNVCKEGANSLLIERDFLWIASRDKGLLKFDTSSNEFLELSECDELLKDLTDEMIFCLFKDSKENLWIGTVGDGLFCYNLFSRTLKNYKFDLKDKYSLSDNIILSINEDKSGQIWVGTSCGGLNCFSNDTDNFERYTSDDGLSNNMIKGIIQDDFGNLWLSTNMGICKFNPVERKVKNFSFDDGLQSNEFNDGTFFEDHDGTMYFGGINGITYFHPSEIKDNPYIPNIVITDFQIFNESVKGSPVNKFLKQNITYADEIILSHRESVFSFEFAALIFNNPQKNQYAYKMEGFDKDWTYCGTRRQATYTNLNPGDYTFRVKGSNNDSIWNEEGTAIKITITPPYYKTWWFKSLGMLGLIAATGLTYRQRLEKMEKERQEQEEFSRKLIDSQESERNRIASELHDTIAHDILISKNKALMALRHKDDPENLENALKEISDLATVTINDVRNISYDLRPHQLARLGFTKTIISIINDVTKSTGIDFIVETDDVDEVLSKQKEINLYRAIKESVTNIVRHSKATEASLKVSLIENFLIISIADNGIGFDVNKKSETEDKVGLGLPGIIERIKLMNGDISIESSLNKGTVLRFRIPIS